MLTTCNRIFRFTSPLVCNIYADYINIGAIIAFNLYFTICDSLVIHTTIVRRS